MLRISALLLAVVATGTLAHGQERVYRAGNDVTLPVVVKQVKPEYTKAAKDAHIQGVVDLKIVVLESGNVGKIEVTRSLDEEFGLDRQAIQAAKQWEFKPGTKDGKPVPVEITLELTFTLK